MTDLRSILDTLRPDWKPDAGADKAVEIIEVRLLAAPAAIERAAALAAWKKLWEALHPNRRHGGDRRSAKFQASDQVPKTGTWSGAAAERLKLSPAAVYADVQVAERLGRADIERLWDSPIRNDGHALRQFAALEARQRDAVYRRMCADPGKAWEDWLRAERIKAEARTDDAAFNRISDAWDAANAKVRRRFLARLGLNSAQADELLRNLTTNNEQGA